MDELIGRLVAAAGVERTAAATAVGTIRDFLAKEGPADKMRLLLAKLPRAEALMQKAASEGGGMGGVIGRHAHSGRRAEHGAGAGITRQFIAYAREKAGEDAIGEIVGAIPGLSQFV